MRVGDYKLTYSHEFKKYEFGYMQESLLAQLYARAQPVGLSLAIFQQIILSKSNFCFLMDGHVYLLMYSGCFLKIDVDGESVHYRLTSVKHQIIAP